MTPYGVLLSVHVVVAILGLGQLAALGVLAGNTERSRALGSLVRNSRIALVLMFTTGAALDFTAGGAWHELWWFRGSALLMLVLGVLSWRVHRALQSGQWPSVRRAAFAMCGTVGLITALMELKPQ